MLHKCPLLAFIIVLSSFVLVENRSYNNGLIFYDLLTKQPYLPPTVSVSRGRGLSSVKYSDKGSIWSTFGKPCDCSGIACGCCAGIKVKQYNFDQKMCANMTFVPAKEEALLEVYLNEKSSAKYGVSARNPSPFCIPVMMGIPMAMCVQMSDIGLQGNNMNMCMDFVVRLATTDLFEMHFQCMRMGLDGVQYVDKNGQPVLPPSTSKTEEPSDEYYDEVDESENEINYNGNDNDNSNGNENDNANDKENVINEAGNVGPSEEFVESEKDKSHEESIESDKDKINDNERKESEKVQEENETENENENEEEEQEVEEDHDHDRDHDNEHEHGDQHAELIADGEEEEEQQQQVVEKFEMEMAESEMSTTIKTPINDGATTSEAQTEIIDAIATALTTTTTTTTAIPNTTTPTNTTTVATTTSTTPKTITVEENVAIADNISVQQSNDTESEAETTTIKITINTDNDGNNSGADNNEDYEEADDAEEEIEDNTEDGNNDGNNNSYDSNDTEMDYQTDESAGNAESEPATDDDMENMDDYVADANDNAAATQFPPPADITENYDFDDIASATDDIIATEPYVSVLTESSVDGAAAAAEVTLPVANPITFYRRSYG